jgi:hypothetical protein
MSQAACSGALFQQGFLRALGSANVGFAVSMRTPVPPPSAALQDGSCHDDAKKFLRDNVADADFTQLMDQISGFERCQATKSGNNFGSFVGGELAPKKWVNV